MWIVRLALGRPCTFAVMAILIAIMGGLSIFLTPPDIFPCINISTVGVIWSYNGVYMQRGTNVDLATPQVIAVSQ
jgi:multidrug efflux pump subunit AcrB